RERHHRRARARARRARGARNAARAARRHPAHLGVDRAREGRARLRARRRPRRRRRALHRLAARGDTLRVIPSRGPVALLYMGATLSLSALPGRRVATWGLTPLELDLLHIPLFTGLTLVTLWAIVGPRTQRLLVVFTGLTLFAALDEILQFWVPQRV